jgi:hypothetical protein
MADNTNNASLINSSNSSSLTFTDDLTNFFNNDYVFAILIIIAFAYGQKAGPKLPQWLIDFFSKDIVRVLFLSLLLVVRFESRPTVALIIAFAFVYIFQYVYIESFRENFRENYLSTSGIQKSQIRNQRTVKDGLEDDIEAKKAIMAKMLLELEKNRKNQGMDGKTTFKDYVPAHN